MTAAAVLASAEVSVAAQALAAAEQTLRDPESRRELLDPALSAIAAVRYRQPDLPRMETVGAVAAVMSAADLPDRMYRLAGEVLQCLVTTSCGNQVCKALVDLLAVKGRPSAVHEAVIEALRYAADWAPDRLDPDSLLALLGAEHLSEHRRALAQDVIEPCLYGAGDALSVATFDQFAQLCASEDFFRYVCFNASARTDVSPAVRGKAQAFMAGRFPWRDQIQSALGVGRKHVLVVQNIRDAPGDEIVRCVPLMQALLDFNRQLEITLITGHAHLYSHPRVTVAPIRDRELVEDLLRSPYDATIDFFEPNGPAVNHIPDLEPLVQAHIDELRPRVVLANSQGVYPRFELDGRPLAKDLGLGRERVENIYEPACRLVAELGLPLRCGEGWPESEPVLTGLPSPDAESAWAGLTSGNTERRPVAILQPFGESEAVKGYIARTIGSLSLEVGRLIDDGFYVVLLPNGAPWGAPAQLEDAIARLGPADRAHVVAAPDRSQEADLFLRFVRFADLVVSVEGWALHAAYCLGKPYRVLMPPASASWRPFLATRNQRAIDRGLECEAIEEAAPLPQQPRKFALLLALRELGRTTDPQAVAALRRAIRSEDREIRLAASVALAAGAMEPEAWKALLGDPYYKIRAAAAAALLASRRSAASPPRRQLEAYRKIAQEPSQWWSVLAMGDAARPALEAAVDDDDPQIRFQSTAVLQLLELQRRWRPRRTGLGRRLARLLRPPRHPAASVKSAGGAGSAGETILILTPVKDAASCIDRYCRGLSGLTYPHERISLGFLESDSQDTTLADLEGRLPQLRDQFRRVGLWKRDFGYRLPLGAHRWAQAVQRERRSILARSRNHLLLHALDDEDWVLWLDADVIEYPPDIVERLLATGKDIVQPHCVLDYGGPSFDWNAWRDKGRLRLDELRPEGDLVELDAVGGTMLMVRADLHRDGLVFPPFYYGRANPRARGRGEVETEGLGIMAQDMGHACWGMPRLEIRHRRW